MKDSIVTKKAVKPEEIIKEKNKNKYKYIQSTIYNKEIGNQKSTYGRQGFQINPEDGDPQFVKDMKVAAFLVKDKIEDDVAKILFDEEEKQKTGKVITRKNK